MLYIYTDSSAIDHVGVSTTFVLKDDTYNTMFSRVNCVQSAAEAELAGICQSLEYAKKNFPNELEITIYSDASGVLKRCNQILNRSVDIKSLKFTNRWEELKKLCSGRKVYFRHIKSHQVEHNPNKICDYVSKTILQKVR